MLAESFNVVIIYYINKLHKKIELTSICSNFFLHFFSHFFFSQKSAEEVFRGGKKTFLFLLFLFIIPSIHHSLMSVFLHILALFLLLSTSVFLFSLLLIIFALLFTLLFSFYHSARGCSDYHRGCVRLCRTRSGRNEIRCTGSTRWYVRSTQK